MTEKDRNQKESYNGDKPDNPDKSSKSGDSDIESSISRVLSALRELRIGITSDEFEIQTIIEQALQKHCIQYKKEYYLAPRNRIDFYIEGGIGLEVKRGKPNAAQVTRQLNRYASFDEINAIILVVDRTVNIPACVLGKQCILFGLNRLWGVALS